MANPHRPNQASPALFFRGASRLPSLRELNTSPCRKAVNHMIIIFLGKKRKRARTSISSTLSRSFKGMDQLLTDMYSHRKSQPMVLPRRPGLHYRGLRHGHSHGTGSGLPLLRSRAPKVCTVDALVLSHVDFRHHLPMVLLGLFSSLFGHGHEWLHWGPEALRPHVHHGRPFPRQPADS